ncbi:MAG: hypothetical protein ACM3X4_00175 [Ignavibacteriales bacterium]
MKRLVTVEEVRDTYFAGKRRIVVPEDAIITPGARDLMYAFNMELAHGEPAADPPGNQCDTVKGIVESVMAGRSAGDKKRVIEAVMEQLAGRSK